MTNIFPKFGLKFPIWKHLLRKGVGLAQLEPKFHRTKLEKNCLFFKLLDLTAFVSGKITSVYCHILEIFGAKRHFFAI